MLGQVFAISMRLLNSASPSWSFLGRMITLGSVFAFTADMRRIKSTFVSGDTIGTTSASVAVLRVGGD